MINSDLSDQHEVIKSKIDIVEVISHFETLKQKGVNHVCKCLFHNENTASFTISRAKGIYKCFGCGVSGDAIKFIQEHEKVSYLDAIKWLADFYNLTLNDSRPKAIIKHKNIIKHKPDALASIYIPKDVFNKTLANYKNNNFVKFLHTLFEPCIINMLIDKYYIGTSKHYSGGTVFWQVDESGNIRYGKVMGYNPLTGKRLKKFYQNKEYNEIMSVSGAIIKKHNKEKTLPPYWVNNYAAQSPKPSCLFGLHLLNEEDIDKPIAIVESEKTAIVASVFMPSFKWMALGGKLIEKYNKNGYLNPIPEALKDKFKKLAGREVLLVPDLGAIEDWEYLASQLLGHKKIIAADIIKSLAKDYQLSDKSDLCDYFTSDYARTGLIEDFKNAIMERDPITNNDHCGIWLEYSERGLRRIDRQRAYKEMIAAGIFEIVPDIEIHPHYYKP